MTSLQVRWVDSNGEEELYAVLDGGDSWDIVGYESHVFRFYCDESKQPIKHVQVPQLNKPKCGQTPRWDVTVGYRSWEREQHMDDQSDVCGDCHDPVTSVVVRQRGAAFTLDFLMSSGQIRRSSINPDGPGYRRVSSIRVYVSSIVEQIEFAFDDGNVHKFGKPDCALSPKGR